MNANPILLQKKYSRVIECFAKQQEISLDAALNFFYHSETYQLSVVVKVQSPLHFVSVPFRSVQSQYPPDVVNSC